MTRNAHRQFDAITLPFAGAAAMRGRKLITTKARRRAGKCWVPVTRLEGLGCGQWQGMRGRSSWRGLVWFAAAWKDGRAAAMLIHFAGLAAVTYRGRSEAIVVPAF
ncbi:hypothetical protein KCP75_04555 [Salmonella enterica subsp. enterica]|nr:hypothetical protein KCP75_04555 [Salmonella enterica subsp. enterica]